MPNRLWEVFMNQSNRVTAIVVRLLSTPPAAFLWLRRTQTRNQSLNLLFTTAGTCRGISLLFDFFQRGRTTHYGIDNVHHRHIHAGAEIPVHVLLQNRRQLVQWIGIRLRFQNRINLNDVSDDLFPYLLTSLYITSSK